MSKIHETDQLGQNLTIKHFKYTELKPYTKNSRTHSAHQIQQIANSIKEFGFTNPILIDEKNIIIAGHARLEAAKLLAIETIPVIQLLHLNKVQKKALVIADNKLAENAGWDLEVLHAELICISELELDFDLTLTGFEVPEIDIMMQNDVADDHEPDVPEPPENPISQIGDLWHLGPHRLLCADATQKQSYQKLMGGNKAHVVFTDPPYNVPVSGHICGNGNIKHSEFKMASGEMSRTEFTTFLNSTFTSLRNHSVDGSLHYLCMDWRHIPELQEAAKDYTEIKNLCVWNKSNGGMGSLYRSKHELIFVYKNGTAPHINNIELGKYGRYRTNVWDYAGVNTLQNTKDLEMHPTVKPVALIRDAILDCTKRRDIVLDVFGGSGSTLIAAEECGRIAYLMELDPKYIDVILQRYSDQAGTEPVHADGTPFSKMKEVRHV